MTACTICSPASQLQEYGHTHQGEVALLFLAQLLIGLISCIINHHCKKDSMILTTWRV